MFDAVCHHQLTERNLVDRLAFRPGKIHIFWGLEFISISTFFGYALNKTTPYFEILGHRILLQIYPFLSEIMDELDVISSLALHPPGISPTILELSRYFLHYSTTLIRTCCVLCLSLKPQRICLNSSLK